MEQTIKHNGTPSLRISTSAGCNHRCEFCQVGGDYKSDFGGAALGYGNAYFESIKRFFYAGVRHFSLTGGEPLFDPQITFMIAEFILQLLKQERQHGLTDNYLRINTNGVLIEHNIEHMTMFDLVKISLHTLREDRYGSITGSHTPGKDIERVINGIGLLTQAHVPIRIQTVVTKENYEEMYDIISFCEGIEGVVELKLLEISPYTELWRKGETGHAYWRRCFISLDKLEKDLAASCEFFGEVHSVGGYGNRMNVYKTSKGLPIRLRRIDKGAFYGQKCEACCAYPICGDGHCNLELGPNHLIKVCRPKEGRVFRLGEEMTAIEYFLRTQFSINNSLTTAIENLTTHSQANWSNVCPTDGPDLMGSVCCQLEGNTQRNFTPHLKAISLHSEDVRNPH